MSQNRPYMPLKPVLIIREMFFETHAVIRLRRERHVQAPKGPARTPKRRKIGESGKIHVDILRTLRRGRFNSNRQNKKASGTTDEKFRE